MRTRLLLLLFCFTGLLASCQREKETRVTDFVDPFIGTAGQGHCFPGATVPFGGIQLSPDNPRSAWEWCSGYHYSDSIISSFSHSHLSGTGIGDLQDIRLLPVTTRPRPDEHAIDFIEKGYAKFSHANETAEPGYYSVTFDNGIKTELTATPRCGMHAYQYPENSVHGLTLDLTTARNWDRTVMTSIKKINNRTIQGYRKSTGWAKDQHVYFFMEFSQDVDIWAGSDTLKLLKNGQKLVSNQGYAFIDLGTTTNKVLVKVSLSSANCEGAAANLDKELSHWSFDKVKREAKQQWKRILSRIKVEGANKEETRVFYTALYHAYLAPYLFSDVHGNYKGPDGEIHSVGKANQYTVFSLWDTFRATHPLFTITQKDRVNDMIKSFIRHYEAYGLLPRWELMGNETYCMIGNHAIPVITEAYLKGIRDFDVEKAYEAMKETSLSRGDGLGLFRTYNYIPCDLEKESVAKTLEYAYDDWCMAQMAKALNKEDDYLFFIKASKNYKNVFDATTGFMRAELSNGNWKTPFSPFASAHRDDDYTEGNAWQYSWLVPHDVEGLIALHGGKTAFANKLDSLFTLHSIIEGDNVSPDISGLIGQYAQGNEPSHHVAYLFNYTDTPYKTQYYVDKIRRELYTDRPDGICGNEDCGQMSAWYIFSAMGFYPVNPSDGKYQLGTPLFKKVTIKLGQDRKFVIQANRENDRYIYVKEVLLNGDKLDRTWITHDEIMNGGKLEFVLTPEIPQK